MQTDSHPGTKEMKELTLQRSVSENKNTVSAASLESELRRWKLILSTSFILGSGVGSVGLILGLVSLSHVLKGYWLIDTFSAILLVTAFPLFILAAHSLDRAHELRRQISLKHCKETGFTVEEKES